MQNIFKALLISLFSSSLFAGEAINVTWAVNEYLNHQVTVVKEFAKEMKKENINVKILLFEERNQGQYDEPLQGKNYDITQNSSARFYDREPKLKIWEIPFLFRSPEHIEKYIDSKNAQNILTSLETENEIAVSFTYAGGFLHMITPEKLSSFASLKGVNCIFDNKNVFFTEIAKPLGIKSNEDKMVYNSKEMCVEELGAELRLHLIRHNNAFNVTGHRVLSRVLRVSKKVLNKMNPKQRMIFISKLKEYTRKERLMVYNELNLTLDRLKIRKIKPNIWTDQMKNEEVSRLKPFYKNLYKEIGEEIEFVKSLYDPDVSRNTASN